MHEYFDIRKQCRKHYWSSCSEFQLYFYKNLFDPDEESKTLNHENLNKKTLETIINEIFSTNVDENEHIIKNFMEEYDL